MKDTTQIQLDSVVKFAKELGFELDLWNLHKGAHFLPRFSKGKGCFVSFNTMVMWHNGHAKGDVLRESCTQDIAWAILHAVGQFEITVPAMSTLITLIEDAQENRLVKRAKLQFSKKHRVLVAQSDKVEVNNNLLAQKYKDL